jgi:hypothetical protein
MTWFFLPVVICATMMKSRCTTCVVFATIDPFHLRTMTSRRPDLCFVHEPSADKFRLFRTKYFSIHASILEISFFETIFLRLTGIMMMGWKEVTRESLSERQRARGSKASDMNDALSGSWRS